ncbi:MAG TPA: hypothetical protein VMD74_03090 [Candidatus Methylomirabilis sp.]|nr:hypothetical protein [Candidatus Methylomirabilis sp.]
MKKAIILSAILALVLSGCGIQGQSIGKVVKPEEAKAQLSSYINDKLLATAPYKATVNSISEDEGLYKLSITVDNETIDAYMTRDAKLFFPQPIDLTKKATTTAADQTPTTPPPPNTASNKTAKPSVELFVMSQCPYGTQIEKGILPVVAALGKKIDFAVKFVDYSMHNQNGPVELTEELHQYCIQKNEPQKYQAYLKCFLQAGDSATCTKTAKINTVTMNSCVAATDKQYKVLADFADQSTWTKDQNGSPAFPPFDVNKADNVKYGVGGSPTLVVNGEVVLPDGRDSESILKTICSGFTTAPAECQKAMSTAQPTAGFDSAASASTGSASCATQ